MMPYCKSCRILVGRVNGTSKVNGECQKWCLLELGQVDRRRLRKMVSVCASAPGERFTPPEHTLKISLSPSYTALALYKPRLLC